MERVLVGVDGSDTGGGALAWSADLVRRAGLELVAARVFVPGQAELPPSYYEELEERQRVELEGWCAPLALPGGVSTRMLDGEPPDALLDAADEAAADLLVVGGRGESGFVHVHLGSVAHYLVHHTRRPLAVVPPEATPPIGRLVAGIDGSAGSLAAVELCADLAGKLGVPVTAVLALEPLLEWVPENDPKSWHQRAEAEVAGWAAPIEQQGVDVDIDVDRDIHPVAALIRALEAHEGSVAVVGARGIGGFTGLRLGRVPLQLLHHSPAAVIVVPEPGSGEADRP